MQIFQMGTYNGESLAGWEIPFNEVVNPHIPIENVCTRAFEMLPYYKHRCKMQQENVTYWVKQANCFSSSIFRILIKVAYIQYHTGRHRHGMLGGLLDQWCVEHVHLLFIYKSFSIILPFTSTMVVSIESALL